MMTMVLLLVFVPATRQCSSSSRRRWWRWRFLPGRTKFIAPKRLQLLPLVKIRLFLDLHHRSSVFIVDCHVITIRWTSSCHNYTGQIKDEIDEWDFIVNNKYNKVQSERLSGVECTGQYCWTQCVCVEMIVDKHVIKVCDWILRIPSSNKLWKNTLLKVKLLFRRNIDLKCWYKKCFMVV